MEAVNYIDAIKAVIQQFSATSDDAIVVSDTVYDSLRQSIQGSLDPHDELMADARLSIDKVCILPFSKLNQVCNFQAEFTDGSMLLIKLLKP